MTKQSWVSSGGGSEGRSAGGLGAAGVPLLEAVGVPVYTRSQLICAAAHSRLNLPGPAVCHSRPDPEGSRRPFPGCSAPCAGRRRCRGLPRRTAVVSSSGYGRTEKHG